MKKSDVTEANGFRFYGKIGPGTRIGHKNGNKAHAAAQAFDVSPEDVTRDPASFDGKFAGHFYFFTVPGGNCGYVRGCGMSQPGCDCAECTAHRAKRAKRAASK